MSLSDFALSLKSTILNHSDGILFFYIQVSSELCMKLVKKAHFLFPLPLNVERLPFFYGAAFFVIYGFGVYTGGLTGITSRY